MMMTVEQKSENKYDDFMILWFLLMNLWLHDDFMNSWVYDFDDHIDEFIISWLYEFDDFIEEFMMNLRVWSFWWFSWWIY